MSMESTEMIRDASFTQTKLVPEIYTKDEINEMFNGIYGEQEKNKEDFQMKLDGVYYPLNDSISWLTTCMEEMRQDIARIQRANDVHTQQYQKQQGNSTAILTRSTSLERSIRKEARSSLIDNNACLSLDSRQPPSTHALVPSTDTRSPPLTEDTHLPLTDTFHPTSIVIPVRTSIDTEPRDMVTTLILVRDERGDVYDQEGHLRNAIVGKEEKLQEGDFEVESLMTFGGSHWCRSKPSYEHRSTEVTQNRSTSSPGHRSTTPTESTASCNAVRIMTHEEFAAKHPHPPSPVYLKIDRHSEPVIDRHSEPVIDRHQETVIGRQKPAPIDLQAPITYRVQMPKIDVSRLNALRPKPKPSENPPEAVRTPSDDRVDSMEVDRVPMGRTLRKKRKKWRNI
ncbi:hypothetical protein F2Q70_00029373 [Brassica cretica]|uniref:Uncharacterized protein n=1 Tax=Brassica cretica TaxID=69181 RepID=A0A8S9FIG6_BRACR|nr:hypothetical protein F2Q70_00029373 [Brassica cretica]